MVNLCIIRSDKFSILIESPTAPKKSYFIDVIEFNTGKHSRINLINNHFYTVPIRTSKNALLAQPFTALEIVKIHHIVKEAIKWEEYWNKLT